MAEDMKVYRASTTAPVNMAVIKYWGKRDSKLNLPTNSSISVTLSQRDLQAFTTASCSNSYVTEISQSQDSLLLNGNQQDITTDRTQACLRSLRSLRAGLEAADPGLPKLSTMPLRIVSTNNFPTAAGLASSAAGFAALVRAIADLYEIPASPGQLSQIARQGSGSACRSLFGGYVAWQAGERPDGHDSLAVPLFPASYWPGMCALILVISATKKDVGSTEGMQRTVATSPLFMTRAQDIVPQRMSQMEQAIAERDFGVFGMLTMRDSNNLHSCCADAYPPIYYMTDASRAAVRLVERVNEINGSIVCAYTFDAGPNCVVFYEEQNRERVEGVFKAVLGDVKGWTHSNPGQAVTSRPDIKIDEKVSRTLRGGVSEVIMTKVGEGPISMQEHLVDESGVARV